MTSHAHTMTFFNVVTMDTALLDVTGVTECSDADRAALDVAEEPIDDL